MARPRVRIEEPSAEIIALPPTVRPVRATRRATAKDRARIIEIEKLRQSGLSIEEATWRVIGTGPLGYPRFRGAARPSDSTLQSKLSALICRTAPEMLVKAKAAAEVTLASAASDAARRVTRLATKKIKEPHRARVALDASRTVLEAVGVGGRSGTNVQVNTAVTLGDGLRALRRADVIDAEG